MVKSKPVKQEVSRTVILPLTKLVIVLCFQPNLRVSEYCPIWQHARGLLWPTAANEVKVYKATTLPPKVQNFVVNVDHSIFDQKFFS